MSGGHYSLQDSHFFGNSSLSEWVLVWGMTAMWVALIARSRIISNWQYIPCSLYQTCLVHDNGTDQKLASNNLRPHLQKRIQPHPAIIQWLCKGVWILVFLEHSNPELVKNLVSVQLSFIVLFFFWLYGLDPQPSTVRGCRDGKQARVSNSVSELWMDPDHSTILSDVFSWHTAFQDVDKDAKRVHANAPKIAYFFPHLALFVNGNLKEQRKRYLCNWLVSWSAWITHLLISDPSPVISRCWHNFLNTISATIASTHSGHQLQASADYSVQNLSGLPKVPPQKSNFGISCWISPQLVKLMTLPKATSFGISTNIISNLNSLCWTTC